MMLRLNFRRYGFYLLAILIAGCAGTPSMIKDNGTLKIKNIYELKVPSEGWKSYSSDSTSTQLRGVTVTDVSMVRCDGQLMNIRSMRSVYQSRKDADTSHGFDPNSFEAASLDYLDGFYRSLKNPPLEKSVVAVSSMIVQGQPATSITYETRESYPSSCEHGENRVASLVNKFIVIKARNQKDFFSWQYNNPRMVILWYGTVEGKFNDGLEDFDALVQSFRFVDDN